MKRQTLLKPMRALAGLLLPGGVAAAAQAVPAVTANKAAAGTSSHPESSALRAMIPRSSLKLALLLAALAGWFLSLSAQATILPAPTVTGSSPPYAGTYLASWAVDQANTEFVSDQGTATYADFDFGSPATVTGAVPVSLLDPNREIGLSRLIFDTDGTPGFNVSTDTVRNLTSTGALGAGALRRFTAVTAQKVRWQVVTLVGTPALVGLTEIAFLNTPVTPNNVPAVVVTAPTVIAASPALNAQYPAANASNGFAGISGVGVSTIEYASNNQGVNTFVDFDLGVIKPVVGFDFYDRLVPGTRTTAFNLIFSNSATFSPVIATKSYSKAATWTASDSFAAVSARYVRFDVTGGTGNTGVGELTFYEAAAIPTVNSVSEAAITSASAILSGNFPSNGGSGDIAHGFVWSATNNTPTLSDTVVAGNPIVLAVGLPPSFDGTANGLPPGTLIYWRAYVTNAVGTGYGLTRTFTTLAVLPTVTTAAQTNAGNGCAQLGGNVTADGGALVTERGVVWGLTPNPTTTSSTKVINGSGTGTFTGVVTGLPLGTTIYVRAYAINNIGTAYGSQISFTTSRPADWVAGRDLMQNEQVTATETQNPNASVPAWSYGYRTTLASSTLTSFSAAQHVNNVGTWTGFDGFIASGTATAPGVPLVLVNGTGAPLVRVNVLNLNPREIEMHPGASSQIAVVRWTAPYTGYFNISAGWQDINASNGDGAAAAIVINGVVDFSQGWVNGGPAVSRGICSRLLNAGDVVDFAVTSGGTSFLSDSTRFDATITPASGCDCAWEVTEYKSATPVNSLADATAVVAKAAAPTAKSYSPTINYTDPDGSSASTDQYFNTGNQPFIGDTSGVNDNNFVTVVRGCLHVCTAGTYTFGFSSDDGASLRIYGATFQSSNQIGPLPVFTSHSGNTLFYDDVATNSGSLGRCTLAAGDYLVEFLTWEGAGLAHAELFYAYGNFTAFNTTDFRLLGELNASPLTSLYVNPGINTPPSFSLPASSPAKVAGEVWVQRGPQQKWNSVASSADGRKMAAVVEGGRIWRSLDNGVTWSQETVPPVANWRTICSSADGNRLAATVNGGNIWTYSSGVWTERPLFLPAQWYGISCSADGMRLAATVSGGGIVTSGDGGVTWTASSAPFPKDWRHIASSGKGDRLIAGASADGLYKSSDFGLSWQKEVVNLDTDIAAVALSIDGCARAWAGGTNYGRISWDIFPNSSIPGFGMNGMGASLWSYHGPVTGDRRAMACSWNGLVGLWPRYGADMEVLELSGGLVGATPYNGPTGFWTGAAMSADGSRMVATQYGPSAGIGDYIYTSEPGTSGPAAVEACSGAVSIANFVTSISAGPLCDRCQTVAFTVTNTNNALFSVQPAISANGTLTYTPGTTTGTATVTVVAQDNGGTANGGWDTSTCQTFPITILPGTPDIEVLGNTLPIADGDTTPSAADHTAFGTVVSCTGTVDRTFTIRNTSACAALNLNGSPQPVTLTGTGAGQFIVLTQPSPTTVPPLTSVTFVVRFIPTGLGTFTATVNIPSNDPDPNENPWNFAISGTATASTDACVTSATSSAGAFSPAWVPATLGSYGLSVPNAQTTTTVTAVPQHPCATMQVRINGGAYASLASNTASSALALNVGTNTINIRVTAHDGTTVKVYTIIITRSEPLPTVQCPPVNLGLKNTGVDAAGVLQAGGWPDTGYAITSGPGGPPPTGLVVGFLVSSWVPNASSPLSKWIGADSNVGSGLVGTYKYQQTFSLAGFDPSSVVITGRYAADNSGAIHVNGSTTPVAGASTIASTGFAQWKTFTLNSTNATFLPGTNTIEFRVTNDSGLTGLRVEFTSVTATPVAAVSWQTYANAVNAAVSNATARTAIIASPTGDYDLDGWRNYDEIALGTDPASGGSMPQLTNTLAPLAGSGSTQPRLQLSVQVPAAVGIPVSCVASSDLVTWVPALQVSSIPGNPGFNLVTWVAPLSMPANRAFMKLQSGSCQ